MLQYDNYEIIDISDPPEDLLLLQEHSQEEDPSFNDPFWWC